MNATKTGYNSGAPEGLAVPAPHAPPVVLLLSKNTNPGLVFY